MASKIKIDFTELKSFFENLDKTQDSKKRHYSRSRNQHKGQEEIEIGGNIICGGVLIACAPLVLAIAIPCPSAAPWCYSMAGTLVGTGFSMIMSEVANKGDQNKKE